MTEREFGEMVRETKGVVLSAIEKHLSARFYGAIDDVAQETYLRAYRALSKDSFRHDSRLSTWLYTIARNESLRMSERLSREEQKRERVRAAVDHREPDDFTRGILEQDEIGRMKDSIRALPEKLRAVLELSASGHGEAEIATQLSIRRGTVKSRLSRGREMLARSMKGGELT
ncbi:MAG TPA: sigma-70 family RNA polymerase sigma factor [Spirochaetota bacterium]|nr:sigma-70 family RNA polymerase sigma factor [Spirochaetota bacterium]